MSSTTNRRSVLTLFSDRNDVYSHQVRFVLQEKSVACDIINVEPDFMPEDFIELNPYQTLPTLADRDLVLYESNIIMEYLDERYPHPPLLPVYPVARAKARLLIHRMKKDWFALYDIIQSGDRASVERAKKELTSHIASVAPAFVDKEFFLGEEISLVDCYLAPLLWRLSDLDVVLPAMADPVYEYAEKIFAREAFQASLSEVEKELR